MKEKYCKIQRYQRCVVAQHAMLHACCVCLAHDKTHATLWRVHNFKCLWKLSNVAFSLGWRLTHGWTPQRQSLFIITWYSDTEHCLSARVAAWFHHCFIDLRARSVSIWYPPINCGFRMGAREKWRLGVLRITSASSMFLGRIFLVSFFFWFCLGFPFLRIWL